MTIPHQPAAQSGNIEAGTNRIARIKKYIEENISSDLHARATAKKFKISVSSLQHFFQEKEHLSYHSYIEQIRMDKAFQLLTTEDVSVKEVMYACGYKHRTTFNNAFRKKFKHSPKYFKL